MLIAHGACITRLPWPCRKLLSALGLQHPSQLIHARLQRCSLPQKHTCTFFLQPVWLGTAAGGGGAMPAGVSWTRKFSLPLTPPRLGTRNPKDGTVRVVTYPLARSLLASAT